MQNGLISGAVLLHAITSMGCQVSMNRVYYAILKYVLILLAEKERETESTGEKWTDMR